MYKAWLFSVTVSPFIAFIAIFKQQTKRKTMVKLFKLRISRVIPSFQSCRSKDPSILSEDPVPPFLPLSPNPIILDLPPATPPPSKPHSSSFKGCVSSAFVSFGCGLGSKPRAPNSDDDRRCKSPEFKWQKEEKWHVVAKVRDDTRRQKIYNSSVSCDSDNDLFPPPPPPPPTAEKKKRRSRKKKMSATARLRFSTSSAESGLFSSDGGDERDEEETETLVSSSRSFSTTESLSEFNSHWQLQTISETGSISRRQKKKKKPKRAKSNDVVSKVKIIRRPPDSSPESWSPARLSMFKKLMPCGVDGKVKESFAVVKNSADPYGDFKGSMMEMILEKQMFEDRDLEQLLQCFLSLNSKHHHGAIVEAFAEIWEYLFCTSSSNHQQSLSRPLFEL